MTNYLNRLEGDKLYDLWIKTLSAKTAGKYCYGIFAYCEFTKKSCSELIAEAREDYINRVPPWELRHIKSIDGFIQSFKDNPEMSNWTKLGFINAVKNFYRFNKIPVEGINKHSIPASASEVYLDLPTLTLDDVRKAVLSCGVKEKMMKALILTFLSSGQGQADIQKLQGRHLTNIINGVAVVNMTRSKTNRHYMFFIGQEALTAIQDYKKDIGENELVFTQKRSKKPLTDTYISTILKRLADKLGWQGGYFQAHRFRHYFKSQLSGSMDNTFIEYLMGHQLPGVERNYFLGNQDKMIEAYLKNQHLLTVFTDKEVLQKQYDDLKQKHDNLTSIFNPDMINAMIEARVKELMKKG
jgi:integrase